MKWSRRAKTPLLLLSILNSILSFYGALTALFGYLATRNIIMIPFGLFFLIMPFIYRIKVINKIISRKQRPPVAHLQGRMFDDIKDGFIEMKEMLTDRLFWKIFIKSLLSREN